MQTFVESFQLVADNTDLQARGWATTEGTVGNYAEFPSGRAYQIGTANTAILGHQMARVPYIAMSFYFKVPTMATAGDICGLMAGKFTDYNSTYRCGFFRYLPSGQLEILDDNNEVACASAVGVLQANTVHHIEVHMYNNNPGAVAIYVDGFEVATGSGDIWVQDDDHTVAFFGNSKNHYFSDIILRTDNAPLPVLGVHRIHVLQPSADTAVADFIPLAGAGYENIDDPLNAAHDGDLSYVSSSTLNAASEFELTDLPESPDTIHFLQVSTDACKSGESTRGVTAYVKGTASTDGTEHGLSNGTYGLYHDTFTVSPDTATAFTAAEINALKLGFKITT